MRYFYDTEFIEDGRTIDLISIGIVAEDGREYYAINSECNFREANEWVRENVIAHLPPLTSISVLGTNTRHPDYKSRREIQSELLAFIGTRDMGWVAQTKDMDGKPEFWGYYSAYDHVALCQLFGTMMNLPKGWPMYTRDLKQLCDSLGNPELPAQGKGEHHALADARWNKLAYDFLMERQSFLSQNAMIATQL